MQQIEQTTAVAATTLSGVEWSGSGLNQAGIRGAERKRVESVVETLAHLRCGGESLAEVAHDARNMVTALSLYCDLLEEPGVLAAPYIHYAAELRLVSMASRRLVEKLLTLDSREARETDSFLAVSPSREGTDPAVRTRSGQGRRWDLAPAEPIENLAAELMANRNLLAALAGPSVALSVVVEGGSQPVRLTGEDLTRVLINLVKNAAEAMPSGGRVQVALSELPDQGGNAPWLALTIEDNGPGIPSKSLERIFDAGYSTRSSGIDAQSAWPVAHRGLGLAITRSIVEAAGGRIHAVNRAHSGSRLEIELPVRCV